MLVGNEVEDRFGVGNDIVDFIEEDGYGILWGPLCGHHLIVGLDHTGFDLSITVADMGDDVKCGDLCIPKIRISYLTDIRVVDSLEEDVLE